MYIYIIYTHIFIYIFWEGYFMQCLRFSHQLLSIRGLNLQRNFHKICQTPNFKKNVTYFWGEWMMDLMFLLIPKKNWLIQNFHTISPAQLLRSGSPRWARQRALDLGLRALLVPLCCLQSPSARRPAAEMGISRVAMAVPHLGRKFCLHRCPLQIFHPRIFGLFFLTFHPSDATWRIGVVNKPWWIAEKMRCHSWCHIIYIWISIPQAKIMVKDFGNPPNVQVVYPYEGQILWRCNSGEETSRRSGITLPAPSRAHISSGESRPFLHAGPTRKRMVDFCGDVVVVHFYNRRHEDLLMCRASRFSIGKLPEKFAATLHHPWIDFGQHISGQGFIQMIWLGSLFWIRDWTIPNHFFDDALVFLRGF